MNRGTVLPDRSLTPSPNAIGSAVKSRKKMTISARSIAFFADFRPMRAMSWIFAAAVLAAVRRRAVPADAAEAWAPMTASGMSCSPPRPAIAAPPTPCLSSWRARAFHRPAAARSPVASAAAARFRADHRRRLVGQRQRPARRQLRRRPVERDHHRRSLQRRLAGRADLALVSRTRCSVLHAAPQSRDQYTGHLLMGPGSAAQRAARGRRAALRPGHGTCFDK